MPTVHFEVLIGGVGTIADFLEAAVKAASEAVHGGTASISWKASGGDHIQAVINSPGALTVLRKDGPAKRLKFGLSSSSLEVIQAASSPDAGKFCRVHPTALMIKQLSFSRVSAGRLAELMVPHLLVSGAILGSCKWKRGKHVLGYDKCNKIHFFYKENGEIYPWGVHGQRFS